MMKHYLLLIAVSFVAFFINVELEIYWRYAFMDGVSFSYPASWPPLIRFAEQPPVFIFYFFLGWCYSKLDTGATLFSVMWLAVLILFWRMIFIKTFWYEDPTVDDQAWEAFFNMLPSIATVAGFLVANKTINSRIKAMEAK